jgi:hypothetical protein
MKKINRLAAAMAVALSMTAVPQANAEIEFHPSGRGDALLFPVFNGYIENYFTIMNNHSKWIQGHLRFRGAAWSGELRDMDIILSPGDVFVFRVADVDGDGMWEIDQSLDLRNFQYTGLGGKPELANVNESANYDVVNQCSPGSSETRIPQCMDPSDGLIPTPGALAAVMDPARANDPAFLSAVQGIIEYQRHMGYIEFIGEAVLEGMDYNIMQILLGNNPGAWAPYQTKRFSHRGTTAWAWSDAANLFATDRRLISGAVQSFLSDVPNALSGTAFLTIPGVGHGIAYNAEALVNFRTGDTDHRIDNYQLNCVWSTPPCSPLLADRAVIVHDENAAGDAVGATPLGDYVYGYQIAELPMERRISFNNTWGPTLADGDDYNLNGLRPTYNAAGIINLATGVNDDFDAGVGATTPHGLNVRNSIAEVEEAIRLGVSKTPPAVAGPEVFSAYYMDGDIFDKSCEGNRSFPTRNFCPTPPPQSRNKRATPPAGATTLTTLTSYYLAFFPTKFFYGERSLLPPTIGAYINQAVSDLLNLQKPANIEVWNNFEDSDECRPRTTTGEAISPVTTITLIYNNPCVFPWELTFISIEDIKNWIGTESKVQDFLAGRVVISFPTEVNNPLLFRPPFTQAGLADYLRSWPGLLYTFEWDGGPTLTHWRPMQRMHN